MKQIKVKHSRDYWRDRFPLISAYINGEDIQVYNSTVDIWEDVGQEDFYQISFSYPIDRYRIKPALELELYSIYKTRDGSLVILIYNYLRGYYLYGGVVIFDNDNPEYKTDGDLMIHKFTANGKYLANEDEEHCCDLIEKVGGLSNEINQ